MVFPHRPEYDATTNLTVEAWVFLGRPGFTPYTNRFHTILSHNWRESFWFGVTSGNRLRFYRSGGFGMFRDSTNTVPSQRWTHVAASYDGSRVRFYIDGQPAGNEPLGNAGINKAQELVLGNDVNGGLGLFGYLDEVRLWSVARTQTEIAQDRFKELESASGLVARFPEGGLRNSVAGVSGTASLVSTQIWGMLPRDYVAPRSPVAVNNDQNLDEFVAAGAERVIWRYRTGAGTERDGEGYLLYRDADGDRNLYVVVPYTSGGAALDLNAFQRLRFSLMFAPAPPEGPMPPAPQSQHLRVDSPADFTLAPALLRGNGTGWITQSTPARGPGSWDAFPVAGCEFECARIFRIPVSLLGEFSQQPKPVFFGQFAYALPALFLPAYWLPSPADGNPDNPSTWARLSFGGAVGFPPQIRVTGSVSNLTAGAATPLAGLTVHLTNPRNGTLFASTTTDSSGAFTIRTLIYPADAPLRLSCEPPSGPGLWRALDPVVQSNPSSAVQVIGTDRFHGVTYTNRGLSGTGTIFIGRVFFPMIQHREPAPTSVNPRRGSPRITLRTSPLKTTSPTEIELTGDNFHPFCAFHLSHVNGTAPVNPGDPLPAGSTVTNFPLTLVERAPDWRWVRLRLDFELSPAWDAPARDWLRGPYRILVRDEWVPSWRKLEAGFQFAHEYPKVFGFPFDNERDGTQFDEFSNVYRWNAYDCITLFGPFPGANPCLGCRVPNPLYTTFYNLVFTPWVELMTGSCLGMSATSLMFRRGELAPGTFEAPARYPAGFSTRHRIFRNERGEIVAEDNLGPPKPQEHRFRVCDYSEPVNLWAHIHRNQAMQVTAQFLGSVLDQMDGTGLVPLGGSGYSIAGNPVRAMNRIISGGFVNHILCFQDGADVFKSHAMVVWDALNDTGLDAETALVPGPAPGRTVLRVYDPNHPEDALRFFEINRTANTYRYHWRWKEVVVGGVTNIVSDIWSGKGVYGVPVDLFRTAGTMPGADLLLRGLSLFLFGAADAEYEAADGGRWGYDATGRIVETYEGGRAIAPFGQSGPGDQPPTYRGRAAWFFPPTNRPPAEIRVRVRPQPGAEVPPNGYQFYAGGGGATIHLQVNDAPNGSLDRLRLADDAGLLRSLRLEPSGRRTNLVLSAGLIRTNAASVVLQWLGLVADNGEAIGVEALSDHSGAWLHNATGRRQHFLVRLMRAGDNPQSQPAAADTFGPFDLPAGGRAQFDVPDNSLRRLRAGFDANGDGRLESFSLLDASAIDIDPPALRATLLPDGRVRLGWPLRRSSWVLESSPTLGPGAVWTQVETPPAAVAGEAELQLVPADQQWFRLRLLP